MQQKENKNSFLKDNEAFLVSNPINIYYLSAFQTLSPTEREAWLLLTKTNTYIFTNSLYFDELKNLSGNFIPVLLTYEKRLSQNLSEICEKEKIKTILVEGEDLKVMEYETLKKLPVELQPTYFFFQKQRTIKKDSEIELIRKACELADKCFKTILPHIKIGMTEKELAFLLENEMRKKGYKPAFDTIVAIDKNAASPHHICDNTKVTNHSLILFDFGVEYKKYMSDITRMVSMGNPTNEISKAYDVLLKAQKETIQTIFLGMSFKDIDLFCREKLRKNNLPFYSHSTGHGVGLELHEFPKVSQYSSERVEKNQVFTIEPGIYIDEKFGMRIEDTIAITEKGVEILTKFPKELVIL